MVLNAIVLLRGRQRVILLHTKQEEEDQGGSGWSGVAISQGRLAATRSWKGQEMDSPLEPPEGIWPCQNLDFSSVVQILDFWLPEWRDNILLLFYATKSVISFYSGHRKVIQRVSGNAGIFGRSPYHKCRLMKRADSLNTLYFMIFKLCCPGLCQGTIRHNSIACYKNAPQTGFRQKNL